MTKAEILRHAKNAAAAARYGPHRTNPCAKGSKDRELWDRTFAEEFARLLSRPTNGEKR